MNIEDIKPLRAACITELDRIKMRRPDNVRVG